MKISFLKPTTKGYLFAGATTITAVNTYFTSKFILNEATLFQFGFWWYGFGLLYNLLFQLFTKKLALYRLNRKQIRILFLFLLLETISTSSFFYAIQEMANPAMVSFIGNLTPAIVTVLGIFILKEQFTRFELIGVLLSICGSFLVSFQWTVDISHLFIKGSKFAYLTVLAVSINTIWVKKHIEQIHPSLLSTSRVLALLLFSLIFLKLKHENFFVNNHVVFLAAYGSLIGPLLGSLMTYFALQYIPASRSMLIQSVKSFIILIVAYFLLHLLPLAIQIIGGIMTVLGIVIITFKRR